MTLASLTVLLAAMIMLVAATGTASATTGTVDKTKSGLVISDSMTSGNTGNLSLGGTASSYDAYEDSQGLHIGVQSPSSGQWVNYYASPSHPASSLYHVQITLPASTVADGVFNVGLYVEGSDFIPHVACEAFADSTGYYWAVEQSSDAGQTYTVLYTSPPSSLPHTQDCTVITNGNNYLKVYIGGKVVYTSTTLSLGMSAPFVSFVQDDTSSSTMHYATYYNYYTTLNEKVKITNNPANAATVEALGSSGQVFASAPVVSGTATLVVGKYTFPLAATINVYDANNVLLASSPASIYGGDAYSVNIPAPTAPQPPAGLSASSVSTSQINLSWSAPADNGGSPVSGYEIERSTNNGVTWSTVVSNTGLTSTTYSDAGLPPSTTYTYRVSAINAVGTSPPSSTASATTATPLTVPQPPTGLTANAVSASQINLSWSVPSNNGGSAITGYQIERSASGGSWIVIVPNTGSTTYSNTGLAASTSYSYRVSAINAIGASQPSNVASATTFSIVHSITLMQSGLAVSDMLTNETMNKQQLLANQKYWHYGGSATVVNAPYDIFKDSQGLHIGVQSPSSASWSGYYGVAPGTNAALFHAVVSTPVNTVPSDFYENGLYVQTANGNVNYVTCFSDTGTAGTVWAIVSATGGTGGATQFNVLWYDSTPNQPLTRDCTVITNGNNYLKVYLDGTMVYTNSTLNLQMPGPFLAFLEPQTSYAGQMLYGIYRDYYAATDEKIQVTNLPGTATRVDLSDGSGNVLASANVVSGSVSLDIGKYHLPLVANIKAYDSSNTLVASTSGPHNVYGGDVYSSP